MTTGSSQQAPPVLRHNPGALRQARDAAGFKQTELAKLVGITQPYLSTLECGVNNPSEKLLARLAAFCGVSPDSLRAGERAR